MIPEPYGIILVLIQDSQSQPGRDSSACDLKSLSPSGVQIFFSTTKRANLIGPGIPNLGAEYLGPTQVNPLNYNRFI